MSKRNLLCWAFGHQPPVYAKKGWYSPGEEYGRVSGGYVDGLDRAHYMLHAECARCGTEFMVARFHGPVSEDKTHD